jgi:hypothetical protein
MNMKRKLKQLLRHFLVAIKVKRRVAFELRWRKDHPRAEELKTGDLVVVGVPDQYQKWAYLKCPCGCGNQLRLSLSSNDSPSWRVVVSDDGIASIQPSVRQINGCYSHFWLKKGDIDWCEDTGSPQSLWG